MIWFQCLKKSHLTQHRICQKSVTPEQSEYSFSHIQGRYKATFLTKELENMLIHKILFGYRWTIMNFLYFCVYILSPFYVSKHRGNYLHFEQLLSFHFSLILGDGGRRWEDGGQDGGENEEEIPLIEILF